MASTTTSDPEILDLGNATDSNVDDHDDAEDLHQQATDGAMMATAAIFDAAEGNLVTGPPLVPIQSMPRGTASLSFAYNIGNKHWVHVLVKVDHKTQTGTITFHDSMRKQSGRKPGGRENYHHSNQAQVAYSLAQVNEELPLVVKLIFIQRDQTDCKSTSKKRKYEEDHEDDGQHAALTLEGKLPRGRTQTTGTWMSPRNANVCHACHHRSALLHSRP